MNLVQEHLTLLALEMINLQLLLLKFRHVILKTSKEKRQSNHLEGIMFVTPNSPLTYIELYGSQLGEIWILGP